jgi:hypothetical protein
MQTIDEKTRGDRKAARFGSAANSYPVWLRVGFWGCVAIAIATVIRRAVALVNAPSANAPPQLAALDRSFQMHAPLTWMHITCALAFVLLLPLMFWGRTRGSRWLERTFFALGFVVAATAFGMMAYAVGGWLERSAVLVFDSLFAASLLRALVLSRRGLEAEKQRWVLRSVAVLLGIATTRPVMGFFFATAPSTHLTPRQFFGIAFWIGFSINVLAMELWLRRRQQGTRRIA